MLAAGRCSCSRSHHPQAAPLRSKVKHQRLVPGEGSCAGERASTAESTICCTADAGDGGHGPAGRSGRPQRRRRLIVDGRDNDGPCRDASSAGVSPGGRPVRRRPTSPQFGSRSPRFFVAAVAGMLFAFSIALPGLLRASETWSPRPSVVRSRVPNYPLLFTTIEAETDEACRGQSGRSKRAARPPCEPGAQGDSGPTPGTGARCSGEEHSAGVTRPAGDGTGQRSIAMVSV